MENNNSNIHNNSVDEINIRELFQTIWKGKITIFGITLLSSILAVLFSLSLPNIYQSEAILSPVGAEVGSKKNSNIGGLASLAGINLSSQPAGNSIKAMEKVRTLSFFEDYILPNIFLPNLMAVDSWDPDTNKISYNEKDYNEKTKTWNEIPSAQESYDEFKDIMSFTQDYDTGFVSVSVRHQSPHIAKDWVDLIVNQINYFFRMNDKKEANLSIDFLNMQISQTSYTEIKQVIAQLLQNKVQQLTLIEANEFYVFSYLDPPAAMEDREEPNRVSICFLGFIFGVLLGLLIVITRQYFFTKEHY
jgi:LPS O-antigen subunit length determinant protein (WzzB/FepE family)